MCEHNCCWRRRSRRRGREKREEISDSLVPRDTYERVERREKEGVEESQESERDAMKQREGSEFEGSRHVREREREREREQSCRDPVTVRVRDRQC